MKFKLTTETKARLGITLYRIEALIDFGAARKGDKGGWVERESNLSQEGDAWVYGDARVYGNAQVYGDAWVYGDAQVCGNAWLSPVNIIGLTYNVTITDDEIMIGRECHKIEEWRGFDDRRILQMDSKRAAKFWALNGPYLLAICDDRAERLALAREGQPT